LMEKSFGMPLELVHADRMPSPPRCTSDEAQQVPDRSEHRYAESV